MKSSAIVRVCFVMSIMMLLMFGSVAYAAETFVDEGIEYQILNKREVEVVGYEGNITDLEFSSYVDGYSVVSIADKAFQNCTTLTRVDIPYGVEKIGKYAFDGCSSLTEIAVSGSVERIGANAFQNCSMLSQIELSYGIEEIGAEAFSGCTSLTVIEIPGSVEEICDSMFKNNTALTSIELSYGVEKIGESAFEGCTGLTTVSIPGSVESMGKKAFYGCYALSTVELAYGIEKIGDSCFENCTGILDLSIPGSVKTVNPKAFYGCSGINVLEISYGVEKIKESAFAECTNIVRLSLPGSIESVEKNAFSGCTALVQLDIAYGVEKIGDSAFNNCTSLYIVEIGGKSTEISQAAFNNTPYSKGEDIPSDLLAALNSTEEPTLDATNEESSVVSEPDPTAAPTATPTPEPTPTLEPSPTPYVDESIPRYAVSLNVKCIENWFFSMYDINIMIDGMSQAVLGHGKTDTFTLQIPEGEHVLRFANADDASVYGEVAIKVLRDSSFTYELTCFGTEVTVKAFVTMEKSSGGYDGENYMDVKAEFEALGFTNIELDRYERTLYGGYDEGDVWKVHIDDSWFDKGDTVLASDKVTIMYNVYVDPTPAPVSNNLTVDNCPELAAMLNNKADIDPSYSAFATKYKGQIIEFDGRIDHVMNHGNYDTRYDILLSAGDYNPNSMRGPAFKFEDVACYDMDLDTLFLEDEIWVGRNVHIVAYVKNYNSNSGLFFLDPISVEGR